MRKPQVDISLFKERRARIREQVKDAAIIVASHPELIRNHDVHFPYRQDSNFFYLTGFEEPESIFIFRPGKDPETVLFVRKKDKARETWDGFRFGPEGAQAEFGVDQALSLDSFAEMAPQLLASVDRVYYTLFADAHMDRLMEDVLKSTTRMKGRSGRGLLPIHDVYPLLGEFRIFKTSEDLQMLRKACEISAEGHIDVMKATRPGINERTLQGVFIKSVLEKGAAREGYTTIVAGGPAATTLHYVFNDQKVNDGDLLLIDAGAEYLYYTGDITRTYPANGKFSPVQKRIYEKVLKLQKNIIQQIKPGYLFKDLQTFTIGGLTEIMIEEGLLKGFKDEIIKTEEYRRYYPHGVSHWLGMDVHDAGFYVVDGSSRRLEPGMCFTVEPGIYIPADDMSAPKELRGIGIRIEDDICVTDTGCENMTIKCPKEIDALEAIIGK